MTTDAAPAGTTRLVDLSELAIISVRGADAASFLQAQFSNDVLRLSETRSQLAAWCDAKGRVLTVVTIFRREDAYQLLLPKELLGAVMKRLKMFVLRAKVEIADATTTLKVFGIFGPKAESLLTDLGTAPNLQEITEIQSAQCLQLPGAETTYLLVGDETACNKIKTELAQSTDDGSAAHWQRNQIVAGQPQVCAATQGEFIPQMLNLHWLSAVDFNKGCYPGQEVVARLQYRGKLKRRMYLARITATQTPASGAPVLDPDNGNIGQVVIAAPEVEDQQLLLAVLQTDARNNAQINGQPLEILELPYATPT